MDEKDLCIACIHRLSGGTTSSVNVNLLADLMHVIGGFNQDRRDDVLRAIGAVRWRLTDNENSRSDSIAANTMGAVALTDFGLRYVHDHQLDAALATAERGAKPLERVKGLIASRGWGYAPGGYSLDNNGKGTLILTKKVSGTGTISARKDFEKFPTAQDHFDHLQQAESEAQK